MDYIEAQIEFIDNGKLVSQVVDLKVEDFEHETIEQAAVAWCHKYCEPGAYREVSVDWSRWDA